MELEVQNAPQKQINVSDPKKPTHLTVFLIQKINVPFRDDIINSHLAIICSKCKKAFLAWMPLYL